MKKEKLKKFKEYATSLLPQELDFLISIEKFEDVAKKNILHIVALYVKGETPRLSLDLSLDKRKYSQLMTWMRDKLERQDVDHQFEWINRMQVEITLDKISPDQESKIIKSLLSFTPTHFYFVKFYEMLIDLRQYLLIRKQYLPYQKVENYLKDHQFEYQNAIIKRERLNKATKEILGLENKNSAPIKQWENWMITNFNDEYIDGLNRYYLFVRLCFYYLRTNQLEDLELISKKMLRYFKNGKYYSRRLLLNYYNNMLVLFDRKRNFEKAEYYGKLSIKGDGPDKLLYFNNYINVLIKQGKYQESLQQIKQASFRLTEHQDTYSIIGHIANHMRCLSQTGLQLQAVKKGEITWKAYKNEIWQHRWYRFFVAYLEAQLTAGAYTKILRTVHRHKLLIKEAAITDNTSERRSTIKLIYTLASYLEGNISAKEVNTTFENYQKENFSDALDQELERLRKLEVR